MKKHVKRIVKKYLGSKKAESEEEDILPDWIVKVKNEIENITYEEYVKDVDKFFNEVKKKGIEKVLFDDIK
ncbi:hypothetical protein [Methanocaldococcus jannaschii]|nr:hypothetical protein [Methanocaldococcus jannaschii]